MNAIGYMRLSVRDQSRYSLEYQEQSIREYCERNAIGLNALFKDNGESSYTFDRPDYKAVEDFIKKHKGKNQYLIIMDHDRFSRNLSEALAKITELEIKYGIKVIATNEALDIDPSDPNVFMQRAFRYLLANEELLRIRKRTKQGMRHAQESGRYLGRAPYGYINGKDVSGKSILIVDAEKAAVVQRIFSDYLSGKPAHVIHKEAKACGFPAKGNSAIPRVLSNCVYAGLVKVPGEGRRPHRYVKGIHMAIVSEGDYLIAQGMLGNKRPSKAQPGEKFPLRGLLKCECGMHMTAGFSKGKRKYYLYYRCIKHTNVNISGDLLHKRFKRLMDKLSFTVEQVVGITTKVKLLLSERLKDNEAILKAKTQQLEELNRKIVELEEKYLEKREIELSTYRRWSQKYNAEKGHILEELSRSSVKRRSKWHKFITLLPKLTALGEIYERSNISDKHTLVRAVFKHNFTFFEGEFRTPFLDKAFWHNYLKIKEERLLLVEQPIVFSGENPVSSP